MKRDDREWLKALLASHGIKMEVGGCGCCGSPWVKVEAAERTIEAESAPFSMFDDSDAERDADEDRTAEVERRIEHALATWPRKRGETNEQFRLRIGTDVRMASAKGTFEASDEFQRHVAKAEG